MFASTFFSLFQYRSHSHCIPLYHITTDDDGLKFQYHVHTSLDIIDEKLNSHKKSYGGGNDQYLGLLFGVEDYKIYGYVTNTKTKLVCVVQDSVNSNEHIGSLKHLLRKVHSMYVDAVSNPFMRGVSAEGLNRSAMFTTLIATSVATFNNS
jgi:hypothetical protein